MFFESLQAWKMFAAARPGCVWGSAEQHLPSEHRNTSAASNNPRSCSASSQVPLTHLRQLRASSRPTLSRKHSFHPAEISFSNIFCLMLPGSFRTTVFAVVFPPSLVKHFKQFNYASDFSLSLKFCWKCPWGCPWWFLSTHGPNWWGDKTPQRKRWRCKGTSTAQEGQKIPFSEPFHHCYKFIPDYCS